MYGIVCRSLLLTCLLWGLAFAWQGSISCCQAGEPAAESVIVQVRAKDDQNLPLPVQARMEASIQAISQQLLEGKKLAVLEQEKAEYESVIQQVFDKVLIGYTVETVQVVPGQETLVRVSLLPWQDTIEDIAVAVSVEGMSPEIQALLYQDVAGIDNVFRDCLQGLPVAAVDWSNGLLKKNVASFMEANAPEFKADFDVVPGKTAQVKVQLYPLLPVVRNVDLSMRSDTMLNAGLLVKRQKMQQGVNQLIGVPVSFTARHQQELEAYLADILNGDKEFLPLDMHTAVTITPGERLLVMSRSDSGTYRIRLEGWADIGSSRSNDEDKGLLARLHLGRMLSSRDELFVLADFYPQKIKWDWGAGYRYFLPSGSSVSLLYDFQTDHIKMELQQPLSKKWLLRYEYRDFEHHNEYGIRYKLHDFLALEYVVDNHDNWLRLIGYF